MCVASNSLHIAVLLKTQGSSASSVPEAFAAQLPHSGICSGLVSKVFFVPSAHSAIVIIDVTTDCHSVYPSVSPVTCTHL